jgi:hypothetical protein
MIATITPNMSNSEHSLNTLRYADRVKELKGASANYDDGEVEDLVEDTGIEGDEEDENMKESEEELLLDEEFPPETFVSDHHMDEDSDVAETLPPKNILSARPSLLSQARKKPLLPRSDSESSGVNPNDSLDLKGMATAIDPRQEDSSIQSLIKLHRDHIRECSDSGKLESRLLVNLNMKLAKTGGDRNAIHLAFDNYTRELDGIIQQKMQKLEEFRSKIQLHQ